MRTVRGRWAALALALTAFVAMLGLAPGAALADTAVSDAGALKAAVANDGTVVLDGNITVSDELVIDKNVTLDLNGRTLTLQEAATVTGSLTVKDSKATAEPVVSADYESVTYESGKIVGDASIGRGATIIVTGDSAKFVMESGAIDSEGGYTVELSNGAVGTIEGGYQIGQEGGPGVYTEATVSINGGVIVGRDNSAVAGNGTKGAGGTTINISGGTLIGHIQTTGYIANVVYHPNEGTLNISGGTLYADNGVAVLMRAGTANITGGTIISTGSATGKVGDNSNYIPCAGVVVDEKAGYPGAKVDDVVSLSGDVTVTSDEGIDSVQLFAKDDASAEPADAIKVTGGTFSGDVSEFVPEDYELNEDGTVVELPDVAMIGTVAYKSLNAAAAAAQKGETIDLVADVALSQQLVLATDDVTLNLNGHTISCADDFKPATASNDAKNLVSVNSCSGVTVKNGTIVAGLANRNTLNLWNAKDVTIEDMTLDNTKSSAGAPLIVGASEATVAGKLSVVSGGNSWYGINVDARMVGATATPASLTFAEGAVVDFTGIQKTGVYVENTAKVAQNDVTVTYEPSVTFSSNIDGFVPVVIAKSVEATVSNPENAGFVMNADGTSHFHTYVLDATTVKEPTCTAEGYTGNRVCSVCGDTIKGEAVPMVAHQLEVRGYVEPTTTTVGYTGDTVCKVCGTVVAKGETIPTVAPGEVVMFRLYNQWTGEHFYTSSELERDTIVEVGWSYEGVGWIAPGKGAPVYRLYNPYVEGGDHHYTMSAEERDALVEAGWKYEGVSWYSADEETGVPVLREYNPYATTGTHNYTISENEHDTLVGLGWNDEGIAWYAVK